MIESELKNIVRIDGVFYFFLEMTWRFSLCFFGKYVILFFVEEMVWKKESPDWILAGPVGQMAEKNAVSIG